MSYSMKDILKEYWRRLNNNDPETDPSFEDFQKNHQDKIGRIMNVLNLKEEFLKLKTSKGYRFATEENVNFWVFMLMKFSGDEMNILRRGEVLNSQYDSFAVSVYEGIISTFANAGIDDEDLEIIATKLDDILDYPIRKKRLIFDSMQKTLELRIIDNMYNNRRNIRTLDTYEWLVEIEKDFRKFAWKWDDVFNRMNDIRHEEICEFSRTREQILGGNYNIEYAIEHELKEVLSSNDEYCKLEKRFMEISGFSDIQDPKKLREIMRGDIVVTTKKKRKEYREKVEEEYARIVKRMNEIEECERFSIIGKYPDYNSDKNNIAWDFSGFMSSEELLSTAIKQNEEFEEKRKKLSNNFILKN